MGENIHFKINQVTDGVLAFLNVVVNNTDPHLTVTTIYDILVITQLTSL